MPYQWIDPKLFLEHEGVAVYHCYDDDDFVSEYRYTTDKTDCNIDAPELRSDQFDVRDLPYLGLDTDDQSNHAAIIKHAISIGRIIGEPASHDETSSLVVKIVVRGGVAEIIQQPPGVEIEIIDYDILEAEQLEKGEEHGPISS